MKEQAARFPLSWPTGWKRTLPVQRQRARFRSVSSPRDGQPYRQARELSVAEATARLQGELDRLGASDAILSTNIRLRLDGKPRSDQPEPADVGVAVYFRLGGKPRTLACDRWDRVADNVAAVAAHIDCIRAVERYGVGTLEQAFAGYAALPAGPSAEEWWIVLQLAPDATLAQAEEAFRKLARTRHPDAGGSHDAMASLSGARERARRALGAA